MITCPKCFKENQDHYKFCLGCGAELPRDGSPKKFAPGHPAARRPGGEGGRRRGDRRRGDERRHPRRSRAEAGEAPRRHRAASQAPAAAPAAAPRPGRLAAAARRPRPRRRAGRGRARRPSSARSASTRTPRTTSSAPRAASSSRAPRRAPRRAVACAPPVAAQPSDVVLTALRADGSEAGTYTLPGGHHHHRPRHGRHLRRRQLPLAAPRHLHPAGRQLFVKDEGSLNGVYKKLAPRRAGCAASPATSSASGRRSSASSRSPRARPRRTASSASAAQPKGYIGRIALVIGRDATGNAFPIPERACTSAASAATCSSRRTATSPACTAASPGRTGSVYLTDLGQLQRHVRPARGRDRGANGDVLLMGQQLFRVDDVTESAGRG